MYQAMFEPSIYFQEQDVKFLTDESVMNTALFPVK